MANDCSLSTHKMIFLTFLAYPNTSLKRKNTRDGNNKKVFLKNFLENFSTFLQEFLFFFLFFFRFRITFVSYKWLLTFEKRMFIQERNSGEKIFLKFLSKFSISKLFPGTSSLLFEIYL